MPHKKIRVTKFKYNCEIWIKNVIKEMIQAFDANRHDHF